MLLGQDPRRERVRIVARAHRHPDLRQDRSRVELGRHVVDRHPGLDVAGIQDGPMHLEPHHPRSAVRGQQARMDVDRATRERGEVRRPQQLVPAGQDGKLDARLGQRRPDGGVARGRIGVVGAAEDRGRHSVRRRDLESADAGPVADDERHGQPGIEDRLQVGATPGDEDSQPHRGRLMRTGRAPRPPARRPPPRCGTPPAARPAPPRPSRRARPRSSRCRG